MSNDKAIASILESKRAEQDADSLEAFIAEFRTRLLKVNDDRLEDMCITFDDLQLEEPLRKSDLPVQIPMGLRNDIMERSKRIQRELKELNGIISDLSEVANVMLDDREAKRVAALPHCKTCGQVVKPKTSRRR